MKKKMGGYGHLLSKYLWPHWPQLLILGVLLLANIGLQLANPQIIRYFIDAVKSGEPLEVLLTAAGLFMGVAVVQQLMAIGSTYVSQNLGWKSTNALRSDLAEHCLKLDMSFHKAYRPGELIERIDGDVTALFNFFSNLLMEVIGHIVLMGGILFLLVVEDWRIGVAMIVFVGVAFLVMRWIHSFAVPRYSESREKVTQFYGFLGEIFGSTEDIRSNGAEVKIIRRYQELLWNWWPKEVKATMAFRAMWSSTVAIFAVSNALAFGIGGVLWSKGIITVGAVYMIFHYTEMLSMPLTQLQRQMADLQKATASIRRVEKLLQTQSKIGAGAGLELPEGPLAVEIDRLVFEYDPGSPVLHDLSVKLAPGKVLGVLGRTGSGKTTLARLLTRFYDVTGGEIRLNGQPIHSIALADLRQQIAFVTQEVQLFNATVRDNLTFFNSEIEDRQIWDALKEIGLDEWVRSLPDGLDTMLDSDSGGLSAGEAQLLAFVRVFLKDPGLVILDEASSRLDPLTEQLMEGAIKKLFQGRTGIIIAHRLQTIERADEILILEEGQVCEMGQRVELAQDIESYFYNLLQTGMEEVLA